MPLTVEELVIAGTSVDGAEPAGVKVRVPSALNLKLPKYVFVVTSEDPVFGDNQRSRTELVGPEYAPVSGVWSTALFDPRPKAALLVLIRAPQLLRFEAAPMYATELLAVLSWLI